MYNIGFDIINEVAGPRALRVKRCSLTDDWQKYGYLERYIEDLIKRYKNGRVKEAWLPKESVLPEHLYPDVWIANRACDAIEKLPSNRPWFLWISFVGPHEPFDTPKKWKEKGVVKTPDYLTPNDWIKSISQVCELRESKEKWENTFTREEADEFRRDYGANIRLLDEQIGKIMRQNEREDGLKEYSDGSQRRPRRDAGGLQYAL